MRVARVPAPAKINVWLQVLGPRPDGFHNLFTLFHALELADEITVRALDQPSKALHVTGPMLPDAGVGPEHRNLAWRAAEAFQARRGWPRGFEISIVKNIPVGGGLGGGSSDAAAVLRALHALAPAAADDRLLECAVGLGSDVPFFVSEAIAATATGRGEGLGLCDDHVPPPADVLLVVPRFGISTADAYGWLREAGAYDDAVAGIESVVRSSGWAGLDLGNTFERVIEPKFPDVRRYRERLAQAGATIARLSGSGSTVFGLFEHGAPDAASLDLDARVIRTRTARSVVQVEVQQ